MSSLLNPVLTGAVAMASLVAALFFLRFWRQTRDGLFLTFAIAFGLDAAARFVLGLTHFPDETEPLVFVPRLLAYVLIIGAIIQKNRPSNWGP